MEMGRKLLKKTGNRGEDSLCQGLGRLHHSWKEGPLLPHSWKGGAILQEEPGARLPHPHVGREEEPEKVRS